MRQKIQTTLEGKFYIVKDKYTSKAKDTLNEIRLDDLRKKSRSYKESSKTKDIRVYEHE